MCSSALAAEIWEGWEKEGQLRSSSQRCQPPTGGGVQRAYLLKGPAASEAMQHMLGYNRRMFYHFCYFRKNIYTFLYITFLTLLYSTGMSVIIAFVSYVIIIL